MTYSRSGLALFILSAVLAALLVTEKRRALALVACVVVVFTLSTAVNPVTRERAVGASAALISIVGGTTAGFVPSVPDDSGDSALHDNRRYLIGAGLRMFVDHPLVGVGLGGYREQLVSHYKTFIPANIPNPDTVSHTALVTIAAEQGLVGLALIVVFLALLAREAVRNRRNVWAMLPAALIVPILLYSQFEGRLMSEPYLWLCLALFYSATRAQARVVTSHTM